MKMHFSIKNAYLQHEHNAKIINIKICEFQKYIDLSDLAFEYSLLNLLSLFSGQNGHSFVNRKTYGSAKFRRSKISK